MPPKPLPPKAGAQNIQQILWSGGHNKTPSSFNSTVDTAGNPMTYHYKDGNIWKIDQTTQKGMMGPNPAELLRTMYDRTYYANDPYPRYDPTMAPAPQKPMPVGIQKAARAFLKRGSLTARGMTNDNEHL